MHPSSLTFSLLKRTFSIETVLTAKGLHTSLKQRGQRLIRPCPVHGGDNPQAFVVDLTRDLWHCFTRCQGGGDVVERVRRMHHLEYHCCSKKGSNRIRRDASRQAVIRVQVSCGGVSLSASTIP